MTTEEPSTEDWSDQFQPAVTELIVACTSKDRYFDLDAVRGEFPERPHGGWPSSPKYDKTELDSGNHHTRTHPAGAPPLDWWEIPTTRQTSPRQKGTPCPSNT